MHRARRPLVREVHLRTWAAVPVPQKKLLLLLLLVVVAVAVGGVPRVRSTADGRHDFGGDGHHHHDDDDDGPAADGVVFEDAAGHRWQEPGNRAPPVVLRNTRSDQDDDVHDLHDDLRGSLTWLVEESQCPRHPSRLRFCSEELPPASRRDGSDSGVGLLQPLLPQTLCQLTPRWKGGAATWQLGPRRMHDHSPWWRESLLHATTASSSPPGADGSGAWSQWAAALWKELRAYRWWSVAMAERLFFVRRVELHVAVPASLSGRHAATTADASAQLVSLISFPPTRVGGWSSAATPGEGAVSDTLLCDAEVVRRYAEALKLSRSSPPPAGLLSRLSRWMAGTPAASPTQDATAAFTRPHEWEPTGEGGAPIKYSAAHGRHNAAVLRTYVVGELGLEQTHQYPLLSSWPPLMLWLGLRRLVQYVEMLLLHEEAMPAGTPCSDGSAGVSPEILRFTATMPSNVGVCLSLAALEDARASSSRGRALAPFTRRVLLRELLVFDWTWMYLLVAYLVVSRAKPLVVGSRALQLILAGALGSVGLILLLALYVVRELQRLTLLRLGALAAVSACGVMAAMNGVLLWVRALLRPLSLATDDADRAAQVYVAVLLVMLGLLSAALTWLFLRRQLLYLTWGAVTAAQAALLLCVCLQNPEATVVALLMRAVLRPSRLWKALLLFTPRWHENRDNDPRETFPSCARREVAYAPPLCREGARFATFDGRKSDLYAQLGSEYTRRELEKLAAVVRKNPQKYISRVNDPNGLHRWAGVGTEDE